MFRKIRVKTGKYLASNGPINSWRVLGLRLCGFSIGNGVYIGQDLLIISDLDDKESVLQIQDSVSIAPRCTIILSSHANNSELKNYIKPKKGSVLISKNCWLGVGVVILPGVKISESCFINSGVIVSENIAPYKMVKAEVKLVIKDINIS